MSESPHPHEAKIEEILRPVYQARGGEAVYNRTPLDEIIEHERGEGDEDKTAFCQEHFNRFMEYLFADGPHPGCVIRRIYAVALVLRSDLVLGMNQTQIAALLGETRAAQSKRIHMMFDGYLHARSMKSETARQTYSLVQRGNQNRKNKLNRRDNG